MLPPNFRPRSSFSGCIYSQDPSDRSAPPLAHGNVCPTCSRPIPTLLLDSATQTPPHSVASADTTTQLPLTEFFLGCIYSKDPLDRSVPPPTHSASLPQPSDIATINSLRLHQRSSCLHTGLTRAAPLCTTPATRSRGSSLLALLTWNPCQSSAGATLYADIYLSFVPAATCKYHPSGNTCCFFNSYLQKECKYLRCGNPPCHRCRPTCGTCTCFQSLAPWFSPWSDLAKSNLTGSDTLILWTVT